MRRLCWGLALAALAVGAPTGALAGDVDIATGVAENLRSSGRMKGYSVGVESRNGRVILKGRVASEEQRQTAISIAQETEGVADVADQMTIGAPTAAKKTILASSSNSSRASAAQGQIAPGQQAQPRGFAPASRTVDASGGAMVGGGAPIPAYVPGVGGGVAPARYDSPYLPKHAWPAYAAYPNYGAVTYPKQYSPTAWPYIGPFYPYPQVPLGWRKVTLEWDDGWWMLDFKNSRH
jgi:hypothetical protein